MLCGEVTSNAKVDYDQIVRNTVREIGFDDTSKGLLFIKIQRIVLVFLSGLCVWATFML